MNPLTNKFKQSRTQAGLVLILAIFVGVGTYLYLLHYQSEIESSNSLSPVYVAKSEISSGTSYGEIISRGLVEIRQMPVRSLPIGAITPSSTIQSDLKTRGLLASGQILVASFFATEAAPNIGLAIPKGMLAVTISVDDVARVGNFVSPGSKVVVFATSTSNSGTTQTRVLLSEALVLGIGSQTSQSVTSSIPLPSPLVTLALPPVDAQKLLLGSKTSEITLALAHENDPVSLISNSGLSTPRFEAGS
ncbi:MAG: Flp pilus assembly protein CpaB [Actinobacteria bacterium]|nr:Flp pilus assembly protein CpaB [Actinomycetota bacterium]NDE96347.1 Flp pilus assembly protein CpaB [Actinomycetota bacterium]